MRENEAHLYGFDYCGVLYTTLSPKSWIQLEEEVYRSV